MPDSFDRFYSLWLHILKLHATPLPVNFGFASATHQYAYFSALLQYQLFIAEVLMLMLTLLTVNSCILALFTYSQAHFFNLPVFAYTS